MLEIRSKTTKNGFSIKFKDQSYPNLYPTGFWESVPEDTRKALTDNLALATTMHLPLIFNESRIIYRSGRPLLEPYFVDNFIRDIPSCAEVDGTDTAEMVRMFFGTQYEFTDPEITLPSPEPVEDAYRAIVGLSFGKDSLLVYAIADEIGLDPEAGYFVEDSMLYEEKHKRELAKKFKKEFGKPLHVLRHDTGKLRHYAHLGLPFSDLGWGLQSTEYAIDLIPLAYALQGKYILFGNEQTTAETFVNDKDGWFIYPCYDQTHLWTMHLDQITKQFSGRTVKTGSLIEPIMDMMVQRTLVHRYPKYAKYQMSCFTETEAGRDYHWCHDCTICSKMYLLCAGSGIDPKSIGFRESMFERNKKQYFTVFNGKSALPYANTATARDEQIFAFYCAVKKGVKGPLVDDFKKSALYSEAVAREDELFKRFIHLYNPITIPAELKEQVMSIFREEISSFEI